MLGNSTGTPQQQNGFTSSTAPAVQPFSSAQLQRARSISRLATQRYSLTTVATTLKTHLLPRTWLGLSFTSLIVLLILVWHSGWRLRRVILWPTYWRSRWAWCSNWRNRSSFYLKDRYGLVAVPRNGWAWLRGLRWEVRTECGFSSSIKFIFNIDKI
jgi:hypothetical protein